MGQRALLIELATEKDRPHLSAHLRQSPLPGQVEVIPGTRTVLVDFRRRRDALAAMKLAKRLKVRRRRDADAEQDAPETADGGLMTLPGSFAPCLGLDDREAVVEVLDVGGRPDRVLVQDMGRFGFGEAGVGRSGSVDLVAARQANRLVGNDDSAAVFEVRSGELSLRIWQTSILAAAGAEVSMEIITEELVPISRGGTDAARTASRSRAVPVRAPFWVFPGETLRLGPVQRGVYAYLGISGGLDAPLRLGSASTDLGARIGPAPVQPGHRYALAGAASRFVGIASVAPTPLPPLDAPTVLRYVPGPREEYFGTRRAAAAGLSRLEGQPWEAMEPSGRAGLRLDGDDPIRRTQSEPLAAEPLIRGAICVCAAGQPTIALAEHPVTSTDPVLGVVVREDLALVAQLRAGAQVRFQAVDPESLGAVRPR
ncbi:carboxyltransferase domain-containing protein [Nesterenkonia lutea]|nr:carboxyltransferase domain-containing protein [Nesterenkonia lutea]